MSVYSLFLSETVAAYKDDVDTPEFSDEAQRFVMKQRYNVLYRKIEEIELDANETKTFSLANYTRAEWLVVVAEVVGRGRFETTGKDFDGVTAITGYQPAYGTAMYPARVQFSTYNVDTIAFQALVADTKIRLALCIACLDTDTRYTENDI